MTKLITIDYEEYEDLKRYKELFEEDWKTELVFEPGTGHYRHKKIIQCGKLYDFLTNSDECTEICLIRKDPREGETW